MLLQAAGAGEPPPAAPDALLTPDGIVDRVMAIASSGSADDPATSARLLGLQWECNTAGADPCRSFRTASEPPWLRGGLQAGGSLRVVAPEWRRTGRPGWHSLLELRLRPSAACVALADVEQRFAPSGAWRSMVPTSGGPIQHYFVVRGSAAPLTEVWFSLPPRHARNAPTCFDSIAIAHDCDGRCD